MYISSQIISPGTYESCLKSYCLYCTYSSWFCSSVCFIDADRRSEGADSPLWIPSVCMHELPHVPQRQRSVKCTLFNPTAVASFLHPVGKWSLNKYYKVVVQQVFWIQKRDSTQPQPDCGLLDVVAPLFSYFFFCSTVLGLHDIGEKWHCNIFSSCNIYYDIVIYRKRWLSSISRELMYNYWCDFVR